MSWVGVGRSVSVSNSFELLCRVETIFLFEYQVVLSFGLCRRQQRRRMRIPHKDLLVFTFI